MCIEKQHEVIDYSPVIGVLEMSMSGTKGDAAQYLSSTSGSNSGEPGWQAQHYLVRPASDLPARCRSAYQIDLGKCFGMVFPKSAGCRRVLTKCPRKRSIKTSRAESCVLSFHIRHSYNDQPRILRGVGLHCEACFAKLMSVARIQVPAIAAMDLLCVLTHATNGV